MKITIEISDDHKLWSVYNQGLPGNIPDETIHGRVDSPGRGIEGLAQAYRNASFAATSRLLTVLKNIQVS